MDIVELNILNKAIPHIIITIFAVMILLNIWWSYYNNRIKKIYAEESNKDYGALLLAGGLAVWAMISVLNLVPKGSNHSTIVNFLSILNNGLFLASFTYFEHGIDWLNDSKRKKNIFITILLSSIFVYLAILILSNYEQEFAADIIELSYSIIVLAFLMGVLFMSFFSRKLYGIAFISIAVITCVIISQLIIVLKEHEVITLKTDYIYPILFISSYSLMSTIFIALAFSWIIEKSTILLSSENFLEEVKNLQFANEVIRENTEDIKSRLKESMAKGENLEKVLLTLAKLFELRKQTENMDSAYLLSGQYDSLKRKNIRGLILQEEFDREFARINENVMNLINNL